MGFQLDFSESRLVLADVLLKDVHQRFCLLRAQINALEILDGDLVGHGLIHHSEAQEEIPEANANLHAVGVILPVFG